MNNQEMTEAEGTYPILKYFRFEHLPEKLQNVSQPFFALAYKTAIHSPHNAETSACLRKILEAKDCAVRAVL